jgi:periplasmic protein TonB
MRVLAPFLCLSMAIHAGAFLGLTLLIPAQSGVAGSPEGDPDRVFVVLVSDQDVTPVAAAPSPASSPASKDVKPEKTEVPEVTEPELRTTINPDFHITDQEKEFEKAKEREKEKSSASLPQTASNAQMRLAGLGKDVHDFQSKVLAAIRQATFFPLKALKHRRHGEVTVAFVINRDGTVSSVEVMSSSTCAVLDSAACEIITKAAKTFPPFPASAREESLRYTVPIHFRQRRSHSVGLGFKTSRPGE